MNRWVINAVLAVLLSGTGFSHAPAKAADRTTEALLTCADERDDARRLRCFDAAVADLRGAPKAPAAAPAATAATATPVAQPQTAAPAVSAEDKFGARGDLRPDRHGALSEITATVAALDAKPYGQVVVTLDNGQVWAELAHNSKLKLKTGDSVKIETGALGSFFLIAPNGRSSKVSRVR